ncbi:uncharacterized protein LOC131307140 [Rhododendron vialii]|uniref:uncharacterized protein LOC131307140 n=1 Tax=Rhododendron vialii TaxID=182163 RepID=UPI00266023EA|nr:uncharacterized protein LOC131307140 [Rhododendron vialii]
MIGSIKVNGRVLEEPGEIKEAAFIRRLTSDVAVQLEKQFEEGEIVVALKDCNSLKAPGPDSFNFSFIKKGWVFLKDPVLKFFAEFHESGSLTKGGKQILDGVLIANEAIHSWKHSSRGGLILKLDFERAYNCVNLGFLLDMLGKMGCGGKWYEWIKECISSVSMSILINGSATKEFQTQKGIRQGDPLSLFLFNIVAEALNIMLERARARGIINGEMKNIKRLLRCFQLMSGLKINFSKSSLCGVKVQQQDVAALAHWECITKSKTNGGLGVKKLLQQNMALLAKWWWRFSKDKESLWVRVTRAKYNLDQHYWLPYIPSSGSVSNVWRDICSVGDSDSCLGRVVQEVFRVQVNFGSETSFWNHVWLGNKCLKDEYPRLFSASDQQGEMFRRRLFDWENLHKEELELRLQNVTLNPSKPDCLRWNWSADGCYTVNSAYKCGDVFNQLRNSVLGSLWKNLSPPKVEIFTWMVIQERVATRSVLQSRNIIAEPQELSCIVDWWHVKWVCPSSVGALIAWWFGNRFSNLEKEIWEACLYATLWLLWLMRNDCVFNNASMLVWDVADLIKTRVAMWMRTKHDIKLYSVDNFKGYLDGIHNLKL